MSRFRNAATLAAGLAALSLPAAALDLGQLGRAPTDAEVAAWDIDIRPDGTGLPKGGMSVSDGETVFIEQCAVCHGDFAEGVGRWPVLAGGQGTLKKARPIKTVGSYWPYLSTVWDYIHRAMPFGAPLSLTDDEVYGVTAYILYMNDIVTDTDFVLSDETFADIHLPNEDGFFDDPRPDTPVFDTEQPCMENCKDEVEITMRATVLDVTPDQPDDEAGAGGEASGDAADSADAGDEGTEVAEAEEAAEGEEAAAEEGAGEEAAEGEQAAAEDGAGEDEAAPDPELVAAGEKVFRKCKACHAVGEGAKNRVGPHLNGVVGRAAAAVEDFRYSKPMQAKAEEGLAWDRETLTAFLADPKGVVPGTKMSFAGIDDAEDVDALIAYLKDASE